MVYDAMSSQMHRRDFLQTAGGILASSAVWTPAAIADQLDERSHEEVPNEFSVHGWRVRWGGWRQPMNQLVMLGIWTAAPDAGIGPDSGLLWVSTTLGACDQFRAFDVFDTTFYRERGTAVFNWSPDHVKLAAKRDALKWLLVSLKTGEPFAQRP